MARSPHAIMLSVEALRDGDWNSAARLFMDETGEALDIYETLLTYYDDARSFQQWFETLVLDTNKEAVAQANEIADRRNALIPPVREELDQTTYDGVEVPEQHPVRWTAVVSVSCCHLGLS